MSQRTYYNEFENELLDDSDQEFVESFSAKKRFQNDGNIKDLTYTENEVKVFYFYPLTTLTGRSLKEGIRIAKEKTTIMCTTPKKAIKLNLYLSQEDSTYDLNEYMDPANPTEQLIKNSVKFSALFNTEKVFDIENIYLITKEKLTDKNFDTVTKYLNQTIVYSSDNDEYSIDFVPIEEFTSLYDSQPLIVVNSEPITSKIKEIGITTPTGTLVGNIKLININGHQPALKAIKGTELFPKLVFPIQTQPQLSTVEYWASKQIIPLQEIFSFLDSKGIPYDQEFSLADFLKLGSDAGGQEIAVPRVKNIKYTAQMSYEKGSWVSQGQGSVWRPGKPEIKYDNGNLSIGTSTIYGSVTSGTGQVQNLYKTILTLENVVFEPENAVETSSAFKNILLMLTHSFWKDLEFSGAIKITVNKEGQQVETIDDEKIYLLSQKYAGQDRYSVTTNVWISWKRRNQDLVNRYPEMIKRIENSIAMLSGYIKSNYSINKGDNDDYKILLPYYFELQNKLIDPTKWQEYTDIVVKLKSNYGNFNSKSFEFKNKDISKSTIFELEYNHFAFVELTKNVETASIPSSAPLDQQTANGEYSKYLMHNFSNIDTNKALLRARYGSGSMQHDPISSALFNSGFFEVNEDFYEEILITSFYGYGDWIINLISNNKVITIKQSLFSKADSTKTLINLII